MGIIKGLTFTLLGLVIFLTAEILVYGYGKSPRWEMAK